MKTNTKQLNQSARQAGSSVIDISMETRVRRQAGVVLCHVDGKHMLVPAMTNEVDLDCLFLLNSTGAFIWERLDGRRQVRILGEAMAQAFKIESGRAVTDVLDFLAVLLENNLVEPTEPHWY
jgi:hypothetical protein